MRAHCSLYRDPKGCPQSRYKICIATYPSGHTMGERAQAGCVVVPPGRIIGSSRSVLLRPSACSVVSWPDVPTVSRYNMLYRDQDWEMGSSPPSCLQPFFFSTHYFFSLFQLLQDHNIYIYIYIYIFMSSVEQNKFI